MGQILAYSLPQLLFLFKNADLKQSISSNLFCSNASIYSSWISPKFKFTTY